MATEFVIMLPAQHSAAVESALAALEQLDQIEAAWSIFQPGSEVARINRDAAEQPVKVSNETFSVIRRAVLWSQRTGGAFDITAGPLVETWGFTKRRGRKPTRAQIEQALAKVGYQKLELDPQRRTVRFAQAGMSINLGGIGKGDALDRIVKQLTADGVSDFLLHGGNSSVIAVGDQSPGTGTGWAVGIAHPTKPRRRLAGIWLRDAALATSGSGKQFFHHRGQRYGHVIDPRTGYPSGELLSLTVIMSSAADADACSTGLFVGGSDTRRMPTDWELPPMIQVAAGARQDEAELRPVGSIAWVDPPEGPAN